MPTRFIARLLPAVLMLFSQLSLAEFAVEQPRQHVVAPNFYLSDINGNRKSLADYAGKVVLLNFWASWCGPCRAEMPGMQQLWQKYADRGLVVLAVSADKGSTTRVLNFAKRLGLDFPILLDQQGHVQSSYEVPGLPLSYLISRDGKILARMVGAREWDNEAAEMFIESVL